MVRAAGDAVKGGVRIQWKYDPDARQLVAECVKAPFWIDPALINETISHEIEAALGSGRAA
jgi:hypothetical protein